MPNLGRKKREFRTNSFPFHTADAMSCNIYGWSADIKGKRIVRARKVLKNAVIGQSSNLNSKVDIRAEVRISSMNIPMFSSLIRNLFMYKNISFYETYFLINSVRRTILNLCFRLSNDRFRTIESLAILGISDVFCFERFIKGGHNIHLLPKKFKEVFLKNRTEKKIL